MVNYENGKIYRLVSTSGKQYIGSTTQPLSKRKGQHQSRYTDWKAGKYHYVSSFILFEEGNVDIVLIEGFSCSNKEELLKRERHWIENIEGGCVNKNIPSMTEKERKQQYRETHKDQIKEYSKKYYEKNKNEMLTKNKQWCKNNEEKMKEYKRNWEVNNKERRKLKRVGVKT